MGGLSFSLQQLQVSVSTCAHARAHRLLTWASFLMTLVTLGKLHQTLWSEEPHALADPSWRAPHFSSCPPFYHPWQAIILIFDAKQLLLFRLVVIQCNGCKFLDGEHGVEKFE